MKQLVKSFQDKVNDLECKLHFRDNVPSPTIQQLQEVHEELIIQYRRLAEKAERNEYDFFLEYDAMKKENIRLYRKESFLSLSEQ